MRIIRNLLKGYSYTDYIFDPLEGKTICRWVLMLPGSGCSWAKRKDGGCYMCGFKSATKRYSFNLILPSFIFMSIFKVGYGIVKNDTPDLISIFNGGSFLNDSEIPLKTQINICRRVSVIPSIKNILVESRPEFVTDEKIKLLKKHLQNKKLIIGIGLECASDEVRERCINKGFTRKDYEEAIHILKNNGVKSLAYVFIKPIYLTEGDAIEEAINTAKYAFSKGADYVVFNAALVQRGTKMEQLYKTGAFTPPWLWSVIEIVKRTHYLGPIRVGDFTDEPKPIAWPKNCEKCTAEALKLFDKYKKQHNVNIFDGFYCECKKVWEQETHKSFFGKSFATSSPDIQAPVS